MKPDRQTSAEFVKAAVPKQKPLVCSKCGQEVPSKQLVCDCFQVEYDNERQKLGLARLVERLHGFIFLTGMNHLVPDSHGKVLTLCRIRRYSRPSLERIYKQQIIEQARSNSKGRCKKCFQIAGQVLGVEVL